MGVMATGLRNVYRLLTGRVRQIYKVMADCRTILISRLDVAGGMGLDERLLRTCFILARLSCLCCFPLEASHGKAACSFDSKGGVESRKRTWGMFADPSDLTVQMTCSERGGWLISGAVISNGKLPFSGVVHSWLLWPRADFDGMLSTAKAERDEVWN